MKCPYCGTPVELRAERCAQCEVPITWNGDVAEFHVPEGFVPVLVAIDPTQLPVVESLLAANGIPFEVSDEISQDFMSWGRVLAGYSPVTGPPIVRVPGEFVEAARELIASARSAPAEEGSEVDEQS